MTCGEQASLQFPAVLERLSLHAFDFRKIIQPFMRHEPGLPREMKRHLLALDEKILEAAAWTRNSSLYTCLALACGPAPSSPPGPLEHQASGVPNQPPSAFSQHPASSALLPFPSVTLA